MTEAFFLRALLATLCVALAAGPIGSAMMWQRLMPLTLTLCHAALLGAGLSLLFQITPLAGILGAVLITTTLTMPLILKRRGGGMQPMSGAPFPLLALAYGVLAAGLILTTTLPHARFDMMAYLTGAPLSLTWTEVSLTCFVALAASGGLAAIWQPMLRIASNPDLAEAEGLPVARYKMVLVLSLAAWCAVAVQLLGALLALALLFGPAALARTLSHTPERMALWAAFFGGISVVLGLASSLTHNIAPGPAMTAAIALLFVIGTALRSMRSWRRA